MDSIVYRKLNKNDWNEVESLINDCFSIYRYSNNKKIIKIILHTYLQSCLSQHTYAYVAENNGIIIGFIIGNAFNAYKTIPHIRSITATIWHYINLKVQIKHHSCNLDYYNNMYSAYNGFLSEYTNDFDGELLLFAVASDFQGFGIGKDLLNGLINHWRKHKSRKIFLITDSSCNCNFYNSQGFNCVDQKTLPIIWAKEVVDLYIYLYTYYP